jgi:hypothetical protein
LVQKKLVHSGRRPHLCPLDPYSLFSGDIYYEKKGELTTYSKPQKFFATFLAIIFSIGLVQSLFGSRVPGCSDEQTVDLVKKIMDREIGNELGRQTADLISYTVSAIRTTSTNEQTGAHQCAAQLGMSGAEGLASEIPITYGVEKTDSGDEIYVTVYDL